MSLPMPTVRITEDYMEAYMTVPPSGTPEKYTVEYLTDVLHLNHVKIGILPENLQKIIDNNLYNKEVLVAQGAEAQDGENGYFEYRRAKQARYWMYETIDEHLRRSFYQNERIKAMKKEAEEAVLNNKKTSFQSAQELLDAYFKVIL